MIKLKLTDAGLAARPDVKKWMEEVERALNIEFFPIVEKIQYYIMMGEPYTIDSKGNVKGLSEPDEEKKRH